MEMGKHLVEREWYGHFFLKNQRFGEEAISAVDAEEKRENARSCRQKVLYPVGFPGGYTQCFDFAAACCTVCVCFFSLSEFFISAALPGREKRLRIRKDIPDGRIFAAFTGILGGWILFFCCQGNRMGGKIGSESGAIKDQVNIAFENGCCRAEELLGREQGRNSERFFQDKGDEMAQNCRSGEILPKAADWTAKSCSFALRTGAFWGIGDDRGVLAVQGLCAFFGMDEKERDLGKY